MKPFLLVASLVFAEATPAVAAEPAVVAPTLRSGDTWTYDNTKEFKGKFQQSRDTITLERASATSLTIEVKAVGSEQPPREQLVGPDWSRVRNVNGHQTTVNKPVTFPLAPGKSWTIDYTEANPNRVHTREQFHYVYEVKDWEDVTVPAGKFKALKIEAEGDWSTDVPARTNAAAGSHVDANSTLAVAGTLKSGPQTFTGHVYKAIWYVPEVGRWVKSVDEAFDANGERNERLTSTLESFTTKTPPHD